MLSIFITLTALFITGCKPKPKIHGNIVGKWRIIKSEFECPTVRQESQLNSISTVNDKLVLKFSDAGVETFYPEALRPPVPYKLEGDTLIIHYPGETPPYISRSYIEFLTADKLLMRETKKEVNCILVSTFKRIP